MTVLERARLYASEEFADEKENNFKWGIPPWIVLRKDALAVAQGECRLQGEDAERFATTYANEWRALLDGLSAPAKAVTTARKGRTFKKAVPHTSAKKVIKKTPLKKGLVVKTGAPVLAVA